MHFDESSSVRGEIAPSISARLAPVVLCVVVGACGGRDADRELDAGPVLDAGVRVDAGPLDPRRDAGPGRVEGGLCAPATGLYDETRVITSELAPPGPDDPCWVGTYRDVRDFDQPPPLGKAPGCRTMLDGWSPDGCTHTLERSCESRSSVCSETIVMSPDGATYDGVGVCEGWFEGVDEAGPFRCRMTIRGVRRDPSEP